MIREQLRTLIDRSSIIDVMLNLADVLRERGFDDEAEQVENAAG